MIDDNHKDILCDGYNPIIDSSWEEPNIGKWIAIAVGVAVLVLLVLFWPGVSHAEQADDLLIEARVISQLESSGNPFAKNGEHYGLCQIGRAVLKDYNKMNGTHWGVSDLYNGVINLRIARWYLNYEIPRLLEAFRIPDSEENRITAWRYGIKSVKNGRIASKYIAKYREIKEAE